MADFFIFEHQERQERIFKERKFIEDVLDEELNNLYRFSRERVQAFAEDFRQSPYSQLHSTSECSQRPDGGRLSLHTLVCKD